jgi:hypothetical protein
VRGPRDIYPWMPREEATRIRDSNIAVYIVRQTLAGAKWETAVQAAMKQYGVSRPTVTRAWKEHRELAKSYVATGLPDFEPYPPPRWRGREN